MCADEFVEMPAAGLERGDGGRGEFDEDAVRFCGGDEWATERSEGGGEFPCLVVGVGGVTTPRTVAEDRIPLGGGETHFRRELAGLFHAVGKLAGEIAVKKYDGLRVEEAVFCAAETQDIDADSPREIGR